MIKLAGRIPAARRATRVWLHEPKTGRVLDNALVLCFPAPKSATGEDMAEFHVHGGPAIVASVAGALGDIPGVRLAEPGEFTRRAFHNGLMDLTAVEALSDLIAAETAAQARQALAQLGGSLSALYDDWRARLLGLMAKGEAEIDFSDEEDVPADVLAQARDELQSLRDEMLRHLDDSRRGERLRAGYQIALVGPPNVGKSSLINALAKREVAIVTDEPGTTRDILECHLDLGGYPVTIADMAGLRPAEGRVEAIGVERARVWAAAADLRLLLFDSSIANAVSAEAADLSRPRDLVIATKADLTDLGSAIPRADHMISAMTGQGLDALISALAARAEEALGASESPALTRQRHRTGIMDCVAALDRAVQRKDGQVELMVEDLRLAGRALAAVTGRIDVEQVLDHLFLEFCIGK